jgi:hypothetical protein
MDQDQVMHRVVSSAADTELDQLGELAARAKESIEEYVQEKPHAALGIAAAVGFVLGGGLTPRRLFRLGFAVGGPLLNRQLASEVFKFVAQTLSEDGPEPKPAKRRAKRSDAE